MNHVSLKNGQILHITRITKKANSDEQVEQVNKYFVYEQNTSHPEVLDVFDIESQTKKKHYFFFATEPEYIKHVIEHGYNVPFIYNINDEDNTATNIAKYIVEII